MWCEDWWCFGLQRDKVPHRSAAAVANLGVVFKMVSKYHWLLMLV
jgi:hypothetical protein